MYVQVEKAGRTPESVLPLPFFPSLLFSSSRVPLDISVLVLSEVYLEQKGSQCFSGLACVLGGLAVSNPGSALHIRRLGGDTRCDHSSRQMPSLVCRPPSSLPTPHTAQSHLPSHPATSSTHSQKCSADTTEPHSVSPRCGVASPYSRLSPFSVLHLISRLLMRINRTSNLNFATRLKIFRVK